MMFNHTKSSQCIEIKGINAKTLSIRLREMERSGLIKRRSYNETPPRNGYHLTAKAKSLKPLLKQMAIRSMQNCPNEVFKHGKARSFKEIRVHPLKVFR
jgi:DNA-binding HxlR family transcriptional regulator